MRLLVLAGMLNALCACAGTRPARGPAETPPLQAAAPSDEASVPAVAPAPHVTPLREAVQRELVEIPNRKAVGEPTLEAILSLPKGEPPFPVVILSHGAPRSGDARAAPSEMLEPQRWFLRHGFAVLWLQRRGYGGSEGGYQESYGACDDPLYLKAGRASASDVFAAGEWARAHPALDHLGIILAGQSAGGWASLSADCQRLAGVRAVLNFAGGRGSRAPGDNCGPERLVTAAGKLGVYAKVPSLWIYSENDGYFAPELSRAMFDAYRAVAKVDSQYVLLPPFGTDGHGFFHSARAVALWGPVVQRFLQRYVPDQGVWPAP